jgi:hypothetical protein
MQMTPPETPGSLHFPEQSRPPTTLFHNYIRAFYPYDPATSTAAEDDALLTTVSIKPGDLILIHSVHANGWADGTVLTTQARGWLPTNYCEPYDHPYLRNLLNAMTQFWDLLRANEDSNLANFVRQDYVRGLIAGVRYLLEHADCLHRDAPLVQQNTGIRRMRKGLLADLSMLVQIAKNLQETIGEPYAGEVVHYLLDELMTKAFKVVIRAVGFVDMWTKETARDKLHITQRTLSRTPMTPPLGFDKITIDTEASKHASLGEPVDSARFLPDSAINETEQATAGSEMTFQSASQVARPLSAIQHARAGSVAHRLSLVTAERPPSTRLASDQLAKMHDACISHIGAFIGHQLHNRPSSPELPQTTERLVKACQNMLAISAEVSARENHRSAALGQAISEFEAKLEELIKATQQVFRFSDHEDGTVVVMFEQSSRFTAIATALIRISAEYVAKTRAVIEQIGDFELEKPPTPMSDIQLSAEETAIRPGSSNSTGSSRVVTSFEKRLSKKLLPPPPPIANPAATASFDFGLESPTNASDMSSPVTPFSPEGQKTLSNVPSLHRRSVARLSQTNFSILRSRPTSRVEASPARKGSVGVSIAGSTDTFRSSQRDSGISAVSEVSTRATTPDHAKQECHAPNAALNSFTSISSIRSVTTEETNDTEANEAEAQLLQKTYASELIWNSEGQVSAGSLPALIEQLTPLDAAPDAQFITAFFLTFRLFTGSRELAQGLIERFDYVGENRVIRLRIYNIFKGWIETYWNAEADRDALGEIRYFAMHKLKPFLPSAGERLAELTRKVSSGYHKGTLNGPLVSGVGKTSLSIVSEHEDINVEPIITKAQLTLLRAANNGGIQCSILDFGPLELARQLTLMTSKIFCEIGADELLSLEWGKKDTRKAKNVRAMTHLTDSLAHVVLNSILHDTEPTETKRRALLIKQWTKIAMRCLELNNYDSVMAIMASLNNTMIRRLSKTWLLVSKKTTARLQELSAICDPTRNYAALRKKLDTPIAPCIPFLGTYLTDMTMLSESPKTTELPGVASSSSEGSGEQSPVTVINFGTYRWMAKIISHFQKFQVPYKFPAIVEMQAWMESHMRNARDNGADVTQNYHRRSLTLEPRRDDGAGRGLRPAAPIVESKRSLESAEEQRPKTATPSSTTGTSGKEGRFEGFLKGGTFGFSRTGASHPDLPALPEASAASEKQQHP